MSMSNEELSVIKKRLNDTSKGNWKFGRKGILHSTETHEQLLYVGSHGNDIVMKYVDMKFMENAKQDITNLIAEVERLNSIISNM